MNKVIRKYSHRKNTRPCSEVQKWFNIELKNIHKSWLVSIKIDEHMDIALHIGEKIKSINNIRKYMRNLQMFFQHKIAD